MRAAAIALDRPRPAALPRQFSRVPCAVRLAALLFLGAAVHSGFGCKRSTAESASPWRPRRAHMDHTPHHQGILLMSGDRHAEIVVEPDGAVRVYVSDESRIEPDPDEVVGTIARRASGGRPEIIALRPDATVRALVARGGPPSQPYTDYDLDLTWHGARIQGGIQVIAGGTAATMAAAAAANAGAAR